MIPVTYRHVCLAFLKRVWHRIRRALPVVTWPARVESDAALAAQETEPAAVSPDPAGPEDNLTPIAAHLEYLGYEVRLDPKGWSHARHPYRYSFHFRSLPLGMRLHCVMDIGAAIGNSRAAWLEFLNAAHGRGHIGQFSLVEDRMGRHGVRITAFVSGAYSRQAFALAMDMWHDDVDIVRRKPEFGQESDAVESAPVAVTVN